jgi:hypothetical protein
VCAGGLLALLPGCLWLEAISGTADGGGGAGTDAGTFAAATGCPMVPGLDDAKAPVILFSDLLQGPNTGGVGGNGVFLTLYGLRFGTKGQGDRVLIGGTEVAAHTSWNPSDAPAPDDRMRARKLETITVQPGAAISGDALDVLVIAGGRTSNAVKFSAKTTGKIWFVDSGYGGQDSDGSADKPFVRLASVKRGQVNGGDVVYLKGTFTDRDSEISNEYDTWVLSAASHPIATQDAPVAYVGFPGTPPVIGGTAAMVAKRALFLDDGGSGEGINHLVFANLLFTRAVAIHLEGNDLRFVGNKLIAFPTASSGALEIGDSSNVSLLGNYFRNLNLGAVYCASKLSTADVAFNEVYVADGGFTFDPPPVPGISGLRVFANLFARVNFLDMRLGGGVGSGAIFNNIFVNNGSDTFDLGVDRLQAAAPFVIANNTLVHVVGGLREEGTPQGSSGTYVFRNNAVDVRDDRSTYLAMGSGGANGFSAADHNLYAPNAASASVVSSVESDARVFMTVDAFGFTSTSLDPIDLDVTPLRTSPLLDQGADTGLCGDYFGVRRPMGAGYDVGAIERP